MNDVNNVHFFHFHGCFREERPKVNVTEHENGTVSYTSPQSFYLDLDLSVGDPMIDTFTTLNLPLLVSEYTTPSKTA